MRPARNTPGSASPPGWEARFERKRAHRARGLADLVRHVGDLCGEIDARLERQERVNVLELGCGYGIALLDLVARYGERVRAVGVGLRAQDGDREILRREAVARGIAGATPLPALVYADVAAGLPFADGRFDLVASQVAWLYFGNKIGVVRETMRVLAPGGIAMIDADETLASVPAEYARLVEIWEDGALVPFGEYLRRHGGGLADAPDGTCLRFGKAEGFGRELEPVLEIDLARLHAHWDGVKCVYRRRR